MEHKNFTDGVVNDLKLEFLYFIKWIYYERLMIFNAIVLLFFIKKELSGEILDSFLFIARSMAFCFFVCTFMFCLYKYDFSKLEIIFLMARKLIFCYLISISILTLGYCYFQRENIHILIILIQSILLIMEHDHLIIYKAIVKTIDRIGLLHADLKQKIKEVYRLM